MYPTLTKSAQLQDVSSLEIHPFFKSTHATDWTPLNYVEHEEAESMDAFLEGLATVSRQGTASMYVYAGKCYRHLMSERGTALLEKAKSELNLRLAHEQLGVSESTYSARTRNRYFAKKDKRLRSQSPPSSSLRTQTNLREEQANQQRSVVEPSSSASAAAAKPSEQPTVEDTRPSKRPVRRTSITQAFQILPNQISRVTYMHNDEDVGVAFRSLQLAGVALANDLEVSMDITNFACFLYVDRV
ncbi:hypothetical protein BGZ65_010557 [Modicella reniformis]|uniref:Uncharacterized protein n=1 Tax=Modicella reniformis TaxID=1440133 RepID=A0A9P6JKG5_9FUNG|nr:hypothetical protein BGZ65_010557 [Modicella reniformis]